MKKLIFATSIKLQISHKKYIQNFKKNHNFLNEYLIKYKKNLQLIMHLKTDFSKEYKITLY